MSVGIKNSPRPTTQPQLTATSKAPASTATAAAPSARPLLREGATGPAVTTLQRALAGAGFDPGPIDGDFGPKTRAAVTRFQTARGLEVDGVVGPQTWGALDGSTFDDQALRTRILDIARSQLGTMEATNENDGPVEKYPNYFGRGAESYCADFASWVVTKAGGSLNESYCPTLENELKASGNWKGKQDARPGDLVLFDWDGDGTPDHVGLVEKVNGDGTITTIEGNATGADGNEGVLEMTRDWDTILGFGNPK